MSKNMEKYIKQHDDNKQISMTGSRALVLLITLLESPKTYEEIRQFMIECGIVTKEYSIDTIRIDINTLKTIGCVITKATKRNNHKYGLVSHPFVVNITSDEVDALRVVYKKIVKKISPAQLLEYHRLFEKFAELAQDTKIKEEILGISILKHSNIKIVEELVLDEKKHNKVKISYCPPNHKEICEYDITLEKFDVRSNRLYLYCYNHTLGCRSFLLVSRVKEVLCRMFDKTINSGLDVKVIFNLKYHKDYELDDNEIIIEDKGDFARIEGSYYNEFIAVQRMLSFASDCTILEPQGIKNAVISKLKEMRAIYE